MKVNTFGFKVAANTSSLTHIEIRIPAPVAVVGVYRNGLLLTNTVDYYIDDSRSSETVIVLRSGAVSKGNFVTVVTASDADVGSIFHVSYSREPLERELPGKPPVYILA